MRTSMLQALGGLLALGGVGLGAVVTLRQVRASREGHTIGLFTKAIDQLASADESVRHGGVYALERLADLDPAYRGHALGSLCEGLRSNQQLPQGNVTTLSHNPPRYPRLRRDATHA